MRGDSLRDAIKLNEDGALIKPVFIDARRQPTRQKTAARGLKRWASQLGVRSESVLITDRAIRRNPICFSHSLEECPFEQPKGRLSIVVRSLKFYRPRNSYSAHRLYRRAWPKRPP